MKQAQTWWKKEYLNEAFACVFFLPWWLDDGSTSSGEVSLTKPQWTSWGMEKGGHTEGDERTTEELCWRVLCDIKKKRIPQTAVGKSLGFRLISFCDPTICSRVINHLCAEAPAFHNVLNKGAKTDTAVHFRLCKSQRVCRIYIFASTPPSIFGLHTFFYTCKPLVNQAFRVVPSCFCVLIFPSL